MRLIALSLALMVAALAATSRAQAAPPEIYSQPAGSTNLVGEYALFMVDAIGDNDLAYQWRKNGSSLSDSDRISGATDSILQISGLTTADVGNYSVTVRDVITGQSVTSANAYLKVLVPAAIPPSGQPASKVAVAGSSVTFTVKPTGTTPFSYQWLLDGVEIPGATNASLTLPQVRPSDEGDYAVVVSNEAVALGADAATSQPASLTVLIPPTIVDQPESVTAVEGSSVSFSVEAEGTDTGEFPMTYQWRRNGAGLADETEPILSLIDISASQAGNYTVKIMNAAGSVISSNANLTVYVPPKITTQPASKVVTMGGTATFTVKASGTAPLGYRWFFNDEEIPSQTNSTLTFVVTNRSQGGSYSAIVSNPAALFDEDHLAVSASATLTVQDETVKPTVMITKPLEGARWSNALVNIDGKAADNVAVNEILWRVNGGEWQGATNYSKVASTTWSALSVPLQPGTNLFRAQSTDTSGNKSAFADRRIFYAVPSLLTLRTNGLGTVTLNPAVKSNMLEVGRGYKVTATAAPRHLFAEWTGDVWSTNPALTFLMQSNMTLQANFVTNPFVGLKGTYCGLFAETNETRNHDRSGSFTFTLAEAGTYSARFQLGAKKLSASGKFDWLGRSWLNLQLSTTTNVTVALQLDVTNLSAKVVGLAGNEFWTAPLLGYRPATSLSSNTVPQMGKYTLALVHMEENATVPEGDGFGTLTLAASGQAKFSGMMADGTKVARTVGVSPDGHWSFYASLYKGKGSVLGWGTFTNRDASSIEGEASWIKMPVPGKFYPNGFNTRVEILGSHYAQPPRGVRGLNITNGEVVFIGGSLTAPLTNGIFLTTNNVVTVTSGTNRLGLTFTLSTGAARGSFIHPVTRLSSKIYGVLLPEHNTMGGFFLSTNLSGAVILHAPSP